MVPIRDVQIGDPGSAVVRNLISLGSLTLPVRAFETAATLPVAAGWNLGDVRIIGLLQERRSRRIVGAGSGRIGPREGPPLVE
jgi:hypothetical protein